MSTQMRQTLMSAQMRIEVDRRTQKQFFVLYSSTILAVVGGVAVSVVNTHVLGEAQFGDVRFLQNTLVLGAGLVSFGLFNSAGRLIMQENAEDEKRELVGAVLVLTFLISIIYMLSLYIYSWYQPKGASCDLGSVLRLSLPFVFVQPLLIELENLLQGDNRIHALGFIRTAPTALYLLGILALTRFANVDVFAVIVMQQVVLAIPLVYITSRLRPKIRSIRSFVSPLIEENRRYGFPVFVGSLANVTSAQVGTLVVGYLVDNVNLGYYSLALTVTAPLGLLPGVVGTTMFKEFSGQASIPRKAHAFTVAATLAVELGFLLAIPRVISLLYPPQFSPAVNMSYALSLAAVFHGLGDYYNRFLGAHGLGKSLRNGAILEGGINLIGYGLLVYIFGTEGGDRDEDCERRGLFVCNVH